MMMIWVVIPVLLIFMVLVICSEYPPWYLRKTLTLLAMKAGLLEMADIYVVNKADLPGAELMAGDIAATAARQANGAEGWVPPVLQTSSRDADSFAALDEAIERHRAWRAERVDDDTVRRSRVRYQVQGLIGRRAEELLEAMPEDELDRSPKEIYEALLRRLAASST